MKVVLIRHFPTKGNRLKQYIGRTDEPLDQEAVAKITESLREASFSYPEVSLVVISPMIRCRETADWIYPGIPKLCCEKLRETDFGNFEGKTYEELKDCPLYRQWISDGAEGKIPNGESRAEFDRRCIDGFLEVMEKLCMEGQESVAFVIHGGTIMTLMDRFSCEHKDFYDWQVKNGMGYEVEVDTEQWMSGVHQFGNIRKLIPDC